MLPAELVAAIHGAPDDPEAYLVAADWLQQRGDPHGELIALSIALARDPGLAAAVDALQEAIDPLVSLERRRWPHDWRWGFLRRVEVTADIEVMRELVQAPTAQCLRELVVTGDRASIHPAIEAIIDHAPALRALRSLALPRWPLSPAVQPHWPAFPALERLAIGVTELPVGSVLPRLRELDLRLGSEHDLWSERAPLHGVERLILRSSEPMVDPLRFLAPVPDLSRLTVVGPFGTIDDRGLEVLAEVAEVDVIAYDYATQGAWFRRFATPHRPGESALLSVGGASPVEPGALYLLGNGEPFVIGRSTESNLIVGPTCGRRHATIAHAPDGERWTLTDHLTQYATLVCGIRTYEILLNDGDEVCFGNHVFRFLEHDVVAKAAALSRQLALPARNAELRMSR